MQTDRDKLQKGFNEFVDKNEDEIIKEFCNKIMTERIGDLNLNEYSHFKFWKNQVLDFLKDFYKEFLKDTNQEEKDLNFDMFCEATWLTLDEESDDVLKELSKISAQA